MNTVTNIEKTKKIILTPAERQARRQEKLKEAYLQNDIMQKELHRANIILQASIEALGVVMQRHNENTAIEIIIKQLFEVSKIINPATLVGLKRRSDDLKESVAEEQQKPKRT